MTKKILLIVGILVVVGIALFFIFFSKPQTPGTNSVGFSIRDFLPFGKSTATGTSSTTNQTSTNNQPTNGLTNMGTNQPIPRLRKLSSEPVAGAVIFNVGATSTVRFVEKGTGNVYEAQSDSLVITRLSNTTIPKIVRAFWLPNGSGFLAQTLEPESETIETSFVKLNKNIASTTSESLTPFSTNISKLPTDIKEIAIKPDGTKIFYYTISGLSSNWFVANPDGTGATMVNTNPLTEWLPKWTSGNIVTMQTKGSSEATSYNYSFDVSNKILKKIGINITGISPQTKTLAEKCVQSSKEKTPTVFCAVPNQIPNGNFPDAWYKGLVSTMDYIAKIDTSNNIFYTIGDLFSLSDEKIDVIDISISPDETHLIFRNKIDGFLWMMRIAE